VLTQSDFISIHVPKVAATTNLLNAEAFAKMKDGVYLVNCARGGIVDEDALYDALANGKVAGAALDVFLDEKVNPGNPKLFELKDENGFNKVIGSPHIGASTVEGQIRVGSEVADILIDFRNRNQ
jgi:D-3-phosphoglycerate dehydrogenase